MIVTSSAGRPTVSKTMTIVTRPACGMPAAPIDAAVAVTLFVESAISIKISTRKNIIITLRLQCVQMSAKSLATVQ
jgi:hypothetical protein